MGYSDYSLHAFCYNSGPAFAEHRLNTSHLMASTKFQFLAQLLPKLKARRGGAGRPAGSGPPATAAGSPRRASVSAPAWALAPAGTTSLP